MLFSFTEEESQSHFKVDVLQDDGPQVIYNSLFSTTKTGFKHDCGE